MVPPDDPSSRSDAHEPDVDAASAASGPSSHDREHDDPPLSELAAAATHRGRAKTLGDVAARLPPVPKVPPPPEIAAGTRGRVKTGLAFDFDLGEEAGPMTLSQLTARPAVTARKPAAEPVADDEAPTLAREEAGAADALAREAAALAHAADEDPREGELEGEARRETAAADTIDAPSERSHPLRADSESSGRSGAPRLPVPGMLGKRPAPEFRDARRAPKPPMGPGIVPPGGVVPPGAVESTREPQDTNLLIEVVAAELMEPPSQDALPVVAPSLGRETAAASTAGMSMHASGSDDPSPPRKWMIAVAAALLLGVAVWGMTRGGDPAADDSAKAVAKANPGEAAMVAKTEPPRPAEEARERVIAAADDGAEKAGAAPEDAAEGGDAAAPAGGDAADGGAAASGGEVPEETMVLDGADAEAAPPAPVAEATPASTSSKASSPRPSKSSSHSSSKSSSASKSSSSSTASKPATADASSPAPKSGGSDAKSLLADAKKALNAGNGSKAYSLAAQSNKLSYSTDAIEVMTMASCMKKDEARAKSLFKQVPLFRRSAVKNKCKASGVKVGI